MSEPVLLSDGNPQIAKGFGDEKIAEYIAALPHWRGDVCRKLDRLITEAVPGVVKAIKWNSPFYGTSEKSWFAGLHCMSKYVKVAFPDGANLDPMPPGKSKQPRVRYLDIYEDKGFDEALFVSWIEQASALPGETY